MASLVDYATIVKKPKRWFLFKTNNRLPIDLYSLNFRPIILSFISFGMLAIKSWYRNSANRFQTFFH